MAFQPLTRQSLADGVFDQIVDQIVTGELPDGEALPSERNLADVFCVSRPAVREALKRLCQVGMVAIRQGESTTVRPWRQTAGPELLARLLLRHDGQVDFHVARSVLEVRQNVGPDIAALAARRIDDAPQAKAALDGALTRLAEATDDVERQHAALGFWSVLVDASQNVAYRLMTNALTAAYEPLIEPLAEVMHAEVSNLDGYRNLAAAVLEGDGEEARRTADVLLAAGTNAVLAAVNTLIAAQEAEAAEGTAR